MYSRGTFVLLFLTHLLHVFYYFLFGVPSLLEFFDVEEIYWCSSFHLLLLEHLVEGVDFETTFSFFLCLLGCSRLYSIDGWFHRGQRVTQRSDTALNQILNVFGNLNLIVIILHLFLEVLGIERIDRVRELEPTFLFLLKKMRTNHEMLSYGGKLLVTHHAWVLIRLYRASALVMMIRVIALAFSALNMIGRYKIALEWINFYSFTICCFGGSHCGIKVARASWSSDAYKDRVDVLLGLFAHFIDDGPRQVFRNLSSCISWRSFRDRHFLLVTFWWTVLISNLMLILALLRHDRMMWLVLIIDLLFWLDLESDATLRYLLFRNTSWYYGGNVIILFLFRDEPLCWLMILGVIFLNLLEFRHLLQFFIATCGVLSLSLILGSKFGETSVDHIVRQILLIVELDRRAIHVCLLLIFLLILLFLSLGQRIFILLLLIYGLITNVNWWRHLHRGWLFIRFLLLDLQFGGVVVCNRNVHFLVLFLVVLFFLLSLLLFLLSAVLFVKQRLIEEVKFFLVNYFGLW